jgi:uncharacterized protein
LSDRLIDVCDEGGTAYRATIVTNGWYLTAETARQLSARRVETAQVTIDGPEHVHNVSRPHVSGRGTYQRVLDNIEAAAAEISIAVRVNATPDNVAHLDELLADLHGRGLHDLVSLKINRVIDAPNENAPVATFDTPVFTTSEFAAVELALMDLAARYGFANPILPAPKRVACAVIAPTSVVLGPTGELWKCWDEVGHADAVFGSIFDYSAPADSLVRWHSYSPFDDEQCRSCIALPVCMGGCPHLAFEHPLREAQCGTFRFNYQARVARAARLAGGEDLPADSSHLDLLNAISSPPTVGTPVSLGPTRRGGLDSSRGSLTSRSRPI